SDRVLSGALAWWPYVVGCLVYFGKSDGFRKFLSLCFLTLFSYQMSLSSGPTAPFLLLTCFALCFEFERVSHWRLVAIFGIVTPGILVLSQYQVPPWPSYPLGATIAPDDGLAGIYRPFMGFAPNLPSIDRPAVKLLWFWPALAFTIYGTGVGLLSKNQNRGVFVFGILLVVLSLLDTGLPEWAASISPIASFERILPLANLYPLAPVSLVVGSVLILISGKWSNTVGGAVLCMITMLYSPRPPIAWGVEAASPSARLFSRFGKEQLSQFRDRPPYRIVSAHRFHPDLESSSNSDNLKRILDRDRSTRWGNGGGRQKGDEFIVVSLKSPIEILGLQLDPGSFFTDFPAALKIRASDDCSSNSDNWPVTVTKDPWLGPVKFTIEGAPYYGSQSDVSIFFDTPVRCLCLRIEQIGSRNSFDWSIAELSFFRSLDAPAHE
ncbi:MAG: hypothetical protein KDD64_07530, partial [Bdellovibrionales bacterium]|nr:hypothetical protein [Bdellovibrionales bacterium]